MAIKKMNDNKADFVSMHLIAQGQNITASDAPLIRIAAPVDPTPAQMMRLVEASGVLDFWADDSENGYTADDGEAP
jgi:hypothetical protein